MKEFELLELSDGKLWDWCAEQGLIKSQSKRGEGGGLHTESLADLAFRLRDEAIQENSDNWALACWYVQQWIGFHKIVTYESPSLDGLLNADHGILSKKPKHWIVAALIARRLAGDKNSKDSNE